MAFVDYLAALQHPLNVQSPFEQLMQTNQSLGHALQTKYTMDRQAKADALVQQQMQLKMDLAKRTQAKQQFDMLQKLASTAQGAGDMDAAAKLYNSAEAPATTLGLPFKPIVGGMRALSNEEAAAQPGKLEDLFSYDAQGNFRPAVQDFNNPQSVSRITGFSGYKPTLKDHDPYKDIYDEQGRLVRKGQPKPQPLPFAFGGNGGLILNRETGETKETGYTPPSRSNGFNLSPGQTHYGNDGEPIVSAPPKQSQTTAPKSLKEAESLKLQWRKANERRATTGSGTFKKVDKDLLDRLNADSDARIDQLFGQQKQLDAANAATAKADALDAKLGIKPTPPRPTTLNDSQTDEIGRMLDRTFGANSLERFGNTLEYKKMAEYYGNRMRGKPVGRAPVTTDRINAMKGSSKVSAAVDSILARYGLGDKA